MFDKLDGLTVFLWPRDLKYLKRSCGSQIRRPDFHRLVAHHDAYEVVVPGLQDHRLGTRLRDRRTFRVSSLRSRQIMHVSGAVGQHESEFERAVIQSAMQKSPASIKSRDCLIEVSFRNVKVDKALQGECVRKECRSGSGSEISKTRGLLKLCGLLICVRGFRGTCRGRGLLLRCLLELWNDESTSLPGVQTEWLSRRIRCGDVVQREIIAAGVG